jgi:undecaprenyl-diphosphatase
LAWFVEHRNSITTAIMTAVSSGGGTIGMAVTTAVAVALLLRSSRHVEAATIAVAAVGAGALIVGFKHLYGRARPPVTDQLVIETNASLPSGHALGSMVVLGVLAVVGVLHIQRLAIRAGVVSLRTPAVIARRAR